MRAARLGAGLTVVPPAPAVDAGKAIIAHPEVPEDKRTCSKCGNPVGRGRDGKPGRAEGFCPKCGQEFSFTPKLQGRATWSPGSTRSPGALAHGGLGWIYLARDRNVSDRWVVLKGLLNSGDPDALAAAIAEQRFLAQVEHPLIVEIYNFVTHEGAGYIVMEYVGGTSLKQILKQRMQANNGAYDPLPVDQALAYILEVLPAFSYLHDLGLVYCDFKPDNLIQVGDAVKLIDLGGVRRIDDQDSAIYGTVGYQAPEVAEVGPSVASDIYTIGRTLVVLCMEFRGYQGTYLAHACRRPTATPLFAAARLAVLADRQVLRPRPGRPVRLGRRAAHPAPRRAARGRRARGPTGTALTSAALRAVRGAVGVHVARSPGRPAAQAAAGHDRPAARLADQHRRRPTRRSGSRDLRAGAGGQSAEVLLARAQARPGARRRRARRARPRAAAARRATRGSGARCGSTASPPCSRSDWDDAKASFNAVYQQVPGELAPKLALAVACENGGQPEVAEGLYRTCAATDAAYVAPAAFGMARVRAERQDTRGRRGGARPGAGHQPRLPGEPPAARRGAAGRRRRSTWPCSTRR